MNSAYVSFRKDAQQQGPSAASVQARRLNSSRIPSSRFALSARSMLTPDQDSDVQGHPQHQRLAAEGADRVEAWPAMNMLGLDVGSKASILNFNASGFEIAEHDIEFLDAPGGFKVPPPSSLSARPPPLWLRIL